MREVKFRAWDTKNKKWLFAVPCLEYLLDDDDACISHHDIDPESAIYKYPSNILGEDFGGRIVWQQYTGLKDSTGKEIYEGDIVDWGAKGPTEVRWISELDGYDWTGWHPNYTYGGKVIGNIFDNPELLQ